MKTIKLVIDYLNTSERTKLLIRQKFMVLTILDTGIRRNELRNLTLSDLDLDNNKIRLKYTKTKKNRTVFISDTTRAAIEDYIDAYKPVKYLFEEGGILLPAYRLQKDMVLLKRKPHYP
ncbi:tyrosine-type recombinase/integrase [Mycoplasmatota bacterium zrk1]